jgi:RNA polymerase sigma-70 factor (ECF subfamily)
VREEDAIVAWFYRSLRNAIVDQRRRRATQEKALDALAREVDEWVDAVVAAPPRVCRCVLRVAQELKPEYAEALRAIEVEGAAVKQFASQHGISSSNAAVRVFRAREALRRGVVATCGACADGGCVDCTCEDVEAHGSRCH